MNLLISCCSKGHPTVWSGVIDSIPTLCWAIVVIVTLYAILKRIIIPIIESYHGHILKLKQLQYAHEESLKKQSFEHEKFWALFKQMERPAEEKIKELQKELENLKRQKDNLEKGQSSLDKDKFEFEKKLLEEKVKIYEDIIKHCGK